MVSGFSRTSSAVGDCEARSDKGSSVNPIWRHSLNADYPLDWTKGDWYHTPTREDADLRALETLPPATVQVVSVRTETRGGEGRAQVTVQNEGTALAFQTRLKLTDGIGGPEVLPAWWDDNYFELFPGESRELAVSYRLRDRRTSSPLAVEVDGWNVRSARRVVS